MKAIRFHQLGGPEVLQLEEVPDPNPSEGEVRIRVRAAGLNFGDTMFREGKYLVRPTFPQIPGMEAAGEVEALGPGATGLSVGDRVMVLGGSGAYAEKLVVKPHTCFPMPPGLSFEQAAALPVQGLTAHHLLTLIGRVRPGETVLVHAAAGGVGSLAVQLAKRLGAKVIGTAGADEKLALVRSLGADVAINHRTTDLVAAVREATGKRGVDVILEMVGGTEAYAKNLSMLTHFGRMIVFGAASGETHGTLEPISLMAKNATVCGYYLTPVLRQRELCAPPLAELAAAAVSGSLRILVGKTYPLAEAAAAHRDIVQRGTTGKLVLLP